MSLRITHVVRSAWPQVGGMESSVTGLAQAQAHLGHHVEVISLRRGAKALDQHREGVRYRQVPALGPRRYPAGLGLVRAVAGAQVVHVHGLDGLLDQLVLWRRRLAGVLGVSSHGGYLHTPRHRRLKALWMRSLTRVSLQRADAVWYTSASDQQAFAPTGVVGEVLPNGVDVGRFAGIPRRPEPGRWLVLGRIDVHKGLIDLVRAIGQLHQLGEAPLRVDVVGPVSAPAVLDELLSEAGRLGVRDRIVIHGGVSEQRVDSLVSRAERAVFPSSYEGFGVAVVELMAAGVPLQVSNIAAHRSLVPWQQVDFQDPRAAAEGLREGPPAQGVARGRAVAASHSWARAAARFLDAYGRIL